MTKSNKKWWYILGSLLFIIYIFMAPRPIPEETVLVPRWITSLESNHPVSIGDTSALNDGLLLPFTLGDRFGYVRDDGSFTINQIRNGYISLSENNWAKYEALPSSIQIMNPLNESVFEIEKPKGYPLFLDKRVFIIGSEQNFITAINPAGEELWTHDFPAPVTCVDGANGYLLAGTLDGTVILLNSLGTPVIPPFEPGGSRLSVILGCAISRDASRLAIISGIENQRFLFLERTGETLRPLVGGRMPGGQEDTFRVVYHEFLNTGFRRPVHINFVDNDSKVVFEREGGLGIYNINSRTSGSLSLDGEIAGLDNSCEDGFFFVIIAQGSNEKRLIVIRSPGVVVNEAPFRSESAFFARKNRKLYIGGDMTMASFELEKR
ncbi:MAG: WD40 repeat domain-containing protein [Treponema sp.]|jgi:hypothetical protein|nr:WD40 repeat domain-containing protein [Treponema sp.]